MVQNLKKCTLSIFSSSLFFFLSAPFAQAELAKTNLSKGARIEILSTLSHTSNGQQVSLNAPAVFNGSMEFPLVTHIVVTKDYYSGPEAQMEVNLVSTYLKDSTNVTEIQKVPVKLSEINSITLERVANGANHSENGTYARVLGKVMGQKSNIKSQVELMILILDSTADTPLPTTYSITTKKQ